jgi:RimJ/RimL family protein N-acetyltransferase
VPTLPTLAVPLTDGVVLLDLFTEADIPTLLTVHGDPEVTRWIGGWWQEPASTDMAAAKVTEWAAWGDAATWAIRDARGGRLLGSINLFDATDEGVDVGYWLAPWGRGAGAMSRSLALVGGYGLGLGFPQVRLYHSLDNPASCAVAVRAGFEMVEELSASWVYPDGVAHDEHLHVLRS